MEKLSFKELMEKYVVVIPMLQRDYAYGRIEEAEKRDGFLRNIKRYLAAPVPHELDFVYGTVDRKNILELLDGQQRITTLFLLHWYLSLITDSSGENHFSDFRNMMLLPNGEPRFTYKTRFSSTDFCNAIVSLKFKDVDYIQKYEELVNEGKSSISETIKKEKWFLPHWNYDPTINGMLTMLDSIGEHFSPSECEGYYKKLTDKGQLVFNFLNLDDFKLTNELYIKMNSRGRALTRFENVKSKILKLYDEASKAVPEKYNAKLTEVNASFGTGITYSSLRDYVSLMMDTKWTDIFWNEWVSDPNHEENPDVDNMMLSFISVLAIFNHIVFKMDGRMSLTRKEPLTREVNSLMNEKDKSKGITIKYDTLLSMFCENDFKLMFDIIDYFNIFNDDGRRKTYLPTSFTQFSEKEAFRLLTNDYKSEMEYENKAKVFAYIKYLTLNPDPVPEHLESWMRFVSNVCSNSYLLSNYTDTFCSSLAGLNYLYAEDIASEIENKDFSKIVTLDPLQIKEERLKMKLSVNQSWKAALENAETTLSYFEGRLRYPLIECCSVSESDVDSSEKIIAFLSYVEKIAAIFPDSSGCKCENELIRALLSKGDYLMYFRSNNTLLKNADRDNSWRSFLKERPDAYHPFGDVGCDERDFFKAVIEDSAFDVSDVKGSLNKIAAARDDSIPAWRRLLIDCPEVISNSEIDAFGPDRNIRWNNDMTQYPHKKDTEDNYEIDLIYGSAITGYHAELFSLCKYYELRDKTFGRLGKVKYRRVKTSIEQPYFCLIKGDEEYVKVLYEDDLCFRFVFNDGSENNRIAYEDVERELLLL